MSPDSGPPVTTALPMALAGSGFSIGSLALTGYISVVLPLTWLLEDAQRKSTDVLSYH